jgi:hypothetical protein
MARRFKKLNIWLVGVAERDESNLKILCAVAIPYAPVKNELKIVV